MDIIDSLARLTLDNFRIGAEQAEVKTVLAELLDGEEIPAWFSRMIRMIEAREEGIFYFDETGNMGSVLLGLQSELGWNMHYYGERFDIDFPTSKISLILSREARSPDGKHGESCEIRHYL